jgi:hypothetical protein
VHHLHRKPFAIYHWDTLEDQTVLLADFHERSAAVRFVHSEFAGRIGHEGLDQLEIVGPRGELVQKFRVD